MVAPRYVTTNNHTFVKKMKFYSDAFGTVSEQLQRRVQLPRRVGQPLVLRQLPVHGRLAAYLRAEPQFQTVAGRFARDLRQQDPFGAPRDFAYPDYEVIGAGADNETKDNGGGHAQWALQSFFGRLNYNFKERYLFEANVRFDGSSRFAKGNRWGIFPRSPERGVRPRSLSCRMYAGR